MAGQEVTSITGHPPPEKTGREPVAQTPFDRTIESKQARLLQYSPGIRLLSCYIRRSPISLRGLCDRLDCARIFSSVVGRAPHAGSLGAADRPGTETACGARPTRKESDVIEADGKVPSRLG